MLKTGAEGVQLLYPLAPRARAKAKGRGKSQTPATPLQTLRRARAIAQRNGVRHAYCGNVRDAAAAATRCAGCGGVLIERDGYVLKGWRLEHGACPDCGQRLAGVFESSPGNWGGGRLPLRLQ